MTTDNAATTTLPNIVTELPDTHRFYHRLEEITQHSKPWEIMIFVINDFKHINDLYSYSFGDRTLNFFIAQIVSLKHKDCELYRIEGNGFGMLAPKEHVSLLAEFETIQHAVSKTHTIEGIHISLSISAGLCTYPDDGIASDTLYRNIRVAVSKAKAGLKKQCIIYQSHMSEEAHRDMRLLEELRLSTEHNCEGFHLVYQPIMKNPSKHLYGCEALLRFRSASFPEGISPFVFVPILEESGLILEVGRWIIETAFAQCAKWLKLVPDFQMNINVSARQFDEESFPEFVMSALARHNLNPLAITLELTESTQAEYETVSKAFDFLRKQGLKTAFDDFGTGYASLDIFRTISGDELKIDRSFLERITFDVTDQILLKSIINMCKSMNILTCVEGIETVEIEHIVSEMNPDLLQGYLYSRPIDSAVFEDLFLNKIQMKEGESPKESLPAMRYTTLRPAQPMSLAEIFNNAYAGIFQVGMDEHFSFLTCNEGYRRMLGYTAREMEENFGNRALGFVHPEDIQWVNEEIRRQIGIGDTVTIEFRIVRKDGYPLWIVGTGNVVRTTGGNPSLIVNIIDNDNQKRKDLKQLEKCALYEKVLARMPAGVKYLHFDEEFTIEYISSGFLSLLGYTYEEIDTLFNGKFLYMVYEEDRQKTIDDVAEQLKEGNIMHLHYRAYCKDGSLIWVDTISQLYEDEGDGIGRYCSVIIDVTDSVSKEYPIAPAKIANRFLQAAQRWGDVMFEYNFQTSTAVFSKNLEFLLGYPISESESSSFGFIVQQDRSLFYAALEDARSGSEPAPFEIRLNTMNGTNNWCRIFVKCGEFMERSALSAIGKIVNISEEMQQRELSKKESSLDSLTKFLNKSALEEKINNTLTSSPSKYYALFILDIDDFKKTNDEFGHFVGDTVLRMLALRIRNIFRGDDIMARSGGDEFIIFMHYDGTRDVLIKRCNHLKDTICAPLKIGEFPVFGITASIGIACYPTEGSSFGELFENADKALFRVKKMKKNSYFIYE